MGVTDLLHWLDGPSRWVPLVALLMVGVRGPTGLVIGQTTTDTLQEKEWSGQVQEAVTAYKRRNYEQALNRLLPVFRAAPTARSRDRGGTAAYWLGRSYEARSRLRMARRVWAVGVEESLKRGELDVRSADAYVRAVFQDSVKAEYHQAAGLYLLLLEEADGALPPKGRHLIRRHVAQAEFLLPESLSEKIFRDQGKNRRLDTTRHGGHRLASWWRSQDTKPATVKNERLIEHLGRVAYARAQYGHAEALSGFDDRGRVYVRLGSPTTTKSIEFDGRKMLDVLQRIRESSGNNLFVSISSFPENEFWVYGQREEPCPFLFVQNGNMYRIGGVPDLIPARYTSAMKGRTGRGGAKIDVVLEAMRTAYRQLATHHIAYGPSFNQLAGYLDKMEGARIRSEIESSGTSYTNGGNRSGNGALTRRSDNSALVQEQEMHQQLGKQPSEMARSAFSAAKQHAAKMGREREERVARQETNTRDGVPRLPIATRIVRFLESDGTTSTRVYWGLSPQDLDGEVSSASDPRFINLSVRQMRPDYRVRRFETKEYLTESPQENEDLIVADQQIQLEGDTSMYHLGLQWDQYTVAASEAKNLKVKRLLRSGTVRADSLQPLGFSPKQLEMSDLVPVLHRSEEAVPTLTRKLPHPYPFDQISEQAPLALYFEVYRLAKDEAGQTRYTIEYDMHRRTDRGKLEQLIQEGDERHTSVSTTREGRKSKAKEYILINLADWDIKEETKLSITVRITDERTGQQVNRSVDFQVVPGANQQVRGIED